MTFRDLWHCNNRPKMVWFVGAVQWFQAVVLRGWFVKLGILKLYTQSSLVLAYRLSTQFTATHLKPTGQEFDRHTTHYQNISWFLNSANSEICTAINMIQRNWMGIYHPYIVLPQIFRYSVSWGTSIAQEWRHPSEDNAISIDTIEGNTAINHNKNAGSLLEEHQDTANETEQYGDTGIRDKGMTLENGHEPMCSHCIPTHYSIPFVNLFFLQ